VCAVAALAYAACDGGKEITSTLSPNVRPHLDEAADSDKYAPDPVPEALYPPSDTGPAAEPPAASIAPSSQGGPLRSLGASGPLFSSGSSNLLFDPGLGTSLNYTDDECRMVPIGFPFVFFGQSYPTAGIAANGQLVFNRCSTRFTGTLGVNNEIEVAPAFGDWVMQSSRGGDRTSNVYYQLVGTAPNRRFIVTWNRVAVWPNFTLPIVSTFQAQLFEGSNKILFGYNGLMIAPANVVTGLSSGTGTIIRSAIGLQFFTLDQKNLCYVPSGNTYVQAAVTECGGNRPCLRGPRGHAAQLPRLGERPGRRRPELRLGLRR
jgi:hypothetical protein